MLLFLSMAVTSSTSAELIAVSSFLTFDVYKTYLKPSATSTQLVRVSHFGIILFFVIIASFCCILNAVGIDLTWILTILGVIVGGASIPVGMILLWEPMSSIAATASPWIGTGLGMVAWFVVTKLRSNSISVKTTGDVTNAVAGNITSCGAGLVAAFVLSYVFPGKWGAAEAESSVQAQMRLHKILNGVPLVEDAATAAQGSSADDEGGGVSTQKADQKPSTPRTAPGDVEKQPPAPDLAVAPQTIVPTGNAVVDFLEASHAKPMDPQTAQRATKLAFTFNVV